MCIHALYTPSFASVRFSTPDYEIMISLKVNEIVQADRRTTVGHLTHCSACTTGDHNGAYKGLRLDIGAQHDITDTALSIRQVFSVIPPTTMDDFSNDISLSYYSQPMVSWTPMEEPSTRTLEDRAFSEDPASFSSTQLIPSHSMNLYPSLPISAERTLEYAPFPQNALIFPPSNGFPAGDPVREVEDDEPAPADMDRDTEKMDPEDPPLPADAARWISMPPAQFDREYPGGNPFVIKELNFCWADCMSSVIRARSVGYASSSGLWNMLSSLTYK
ncbi:hypothetical protein CPB85DRAFT_1325120 [Mucidula mucida]|nr:hypothetical protein CPB85DRAFT_1325120 [Mucidula mucida]